MSGAFAIYEGVVIVLIYIDAALYWCYTQRKEKNKCEIMD